MRKPVKLLSAVLTPSLVLAAGCALAAERQSLESLVHTTVNFVTSQHPPNADLKVLPDRLDSRLRLVRCEMPLTAFWAPGSATLGYTTVGLRCEGSRPWKLYLPTRVKLMQPVVVATRPLTRGQKIQRADLRMDRRDMGSLSASVILEPGQILGYVAKRSIPAGRALDLRILKAPRLVERGRRVRMVVAGGGINITMSGTALEHGALGETVRIRNPASRRVVEGVVTGPGRVQLPDSSPILKTSISQ